MKQKAIWFVASMLVASSAYSQNSTIRFSGYTWYVRNAGSGGPGPNNWSPSNVSVDVFGNLHMRITNNNGAWYTSEIYTTQRLGFGRYQFWVNGRVDRLDPNVVLGLFHYPTPDVGPDGTN